MLWHWSDKAKLLAMTDRTQVRVRVRVRLRLRLRLRLRMKVRPARIWLG